MLIDTREDAKWTVYVHIVPKAISGYDYDKYYVGITGKKVSRRWGKNGKRYQEGSQPHFGRAIDKYGWNNIEHHILACHLTEAEALAFESKMISVLHSYGKYGYNHNEGGHGFSKKNMTQKRIRKVMGKTSSVRAVPIYKFTVDGVFVKKYRSITNAAQSHGYVMTTLQKCIMLHKPKDGFYFVKENFVVSNNGRYELNGFESHKKAPTLLNSGPKYFEFDITGSFISSYSSMSEAKEKSNSHVKSSTITRQVKENKPPFAEQHIWRDATQVSFVGDSIVPIIDDLWYEIYLFDIHGDFVHRYITTAQASIMTGDSDVNIRHVANRRQLPANGFVWRYRKDVVATDMGWAMAQSENEINRCIYYFDTNKRFISKYLCTSYAAGDTGCAVYTIQHSMRCLTSDIENKSWRKNTDVKQQNDGTYLMIS